jgi:hypothetical protein
VSPGAKSGVDLGSFVEDIVKNRRRVLDDRSKTLFIGDISPTTRRLIVAYRIINSFGLPDNDEILSWGLECV